MAELFVHRLLGGTGNGLLVPPEWRSGGTYEYERPGDRASAVYEQREFYMGQDIIYVWTFKDLIQEEFVGMMSFHLQLSRDALFEKQKQLHVESFSSAAKYTNVVLVVGYAALLTFWSSDKIDYTPATRLWAAIFLAISVLFFVGWEIVQMWMRSSMSLKIGQAVKDINLFSARMQSVLDFQQFLVSRFNYVWHAMFWTALIFGLAAFGILLSGAVHGAWLDFLADSIARATGRR